MIGQALLDAGLSAEAIGLLEAHGTATPVGDPIEVAALTQAFREHTDQVGYCHRLLKKQLRPPHGSGWRGRFDQNGSVC